MQKNEQEALGPNPYQANYNNRPAKGLKLKDLGVGRLRLPRYAPEGCLGHGVKVSM